MTCEFRRKYRAAELNTNSTKKYSRVSAEFELFSFESSYRKDHARVTKVWILFEVTSLQMQI